MFCLVFRWDTCFLKTLKKASTPFFYALSIYSFSKTDSEHFIFPNDIIKSFHKSFLNIFRFFPLMYFFVNWCIVVLQAETDMNVYFQEKLINFIIFFCYFKIYMDLVNLSAVCSSLLTISLKSHLTLPTQRYLEDQNNWFFSS